MIEAYVAAGAAGVGIVLAALLAALVRYLRTPLKPLPIPEGMKIEIDPGRKYTWTASAKVGHKWTSHASSNCSPVKLRNYLIKQYNTAQEAMR